MNSIYVPMRKALQVLREDRNMKIFLRGHAETLVTSTRLHRKTTVILQYLR